MKAAPLLPARVGKLQSRIMAAFAASVQLDTLTDTEPALREGTQLCCIGRTHLRRRMQQTRCRARKLPSWAASSLKSTLWGLTAKCPQPRRSICHDGFRSTHPLTAAHGHSVPYPPYSRADSTHSLNTSQTHLMCIGDPLLRDHPAQHLAGPLCARAALLPRGQHAQPEPAVHVLRIRGAAGGPHPAAVLRVRALRHRRRVRVRLWCCNACLDVCTKNVSGVRGLPLDAAALPAARNRGMALRD